MSANQISNIDKASAAWGRDMPEWVKLLALAADRTSQRGVADRLGKSSGYVSRLINNDYPGNHAEAETIVRSAFGGEEVTCPIFGPIPLSSCIRNRRRKGSPRNAAHHTYAAICPDCSNNTDGARATAEGGQQ